MKTPIYIISAILAGLLALAVSCDKAAKADNSETAVNTMGTETELTADAAQHDMDAEDYSGHGKTDMEDVTKAVSPAVGHPYSLATCPVSGEELGSMGDPIHMNHEGRDIALCCKGCVPKFEADPASFIAAIDKQIIAEQMESYPLTTCPVSGEALGSMGDSIDRVYDNRLVRFCCAGCIPTFEADPAAYFSKLDEAVIAAQTEDYPLTSCAVMGDPLDPASTVNYVVGNRLVKLCCEDCKLDVNANPSKYFKKIDAAKAS